MNRQPMRPPIDALRSKRPRRAAWPPWRRTLVLQWTVALSCVAVVVITIINGIVHD